MGDPKDNHTRTENISTLVLVQGLTEHERQLVEIITRISSEKAADIVIDSLDDKLVDIVYDKIAQEIGKGVIRKGLWALGIIVTALAYWSWSWLVSKGIK